jgi:hypothetical protein
MEENKRYEGGNFKSDLILIIITGLFLFALGLFTHNVLALILAVAVVGVYFYLLKNKGASTYELGPNKITIINQMTNHKTFIPYENIKSVFYSKTRLSRRAGGYRISIIYSSGGDAMSTHIYFAIPSREQEFFNFIKDLGERTGKEISNFDQTFSNLEEQLKK